MSEFSLGQFDPADPMADPEHDPMLMMDDAIDPFFEDQEESVPQAAPYPTIQADSLFPQMGPAMFDDEQAMQEAESWAAKANRGQEAFHLIKQRHSGITTMHVLDFKKSGSLNDWYYQYADDLEDLLELVDKIDASQIEGLLAYLRDIAPGEAYSPPDFIKVIRKLVLYEDVDFPKIELETRIINFLKKTFVTPEGAAPNDEELFLFLMSRHKDPELQAKYNTIKAAEVEAAELLAPISAMIKKHLDDRLPVVIERGKILTQKRTMEAAIRRGEAINQTAYDSIIEQFERYSELFDSIQDRLDAEYDKRKALYESRPDLFPAWASSGIEKPITVSDLIRDYMNEYLDTNVPVVMNIVEKALKVKAADADRQMDELYAERAEDIKERELALDVFLKEQIKSELQPYEDQLNITIKGYNNQAGLLQNLNNELKRIDASITNNIENRLGEVIGWYAHKNNLSKETMKQPYFINMVLQRIAGAGLAKPGVGVKEGERIFDREIFIVKDGLEMVGSQEHWFWKELPGETSAHVAGQTLADMNTLKVKEQDFKYGEGAHIRNIMQTIKDYLPKVKRAYKMTQERINSPEYIKDVIDKFKASPEQMALEQRYKEIKNHIRIISSQIQSLTEEYGDLLNDLEKQYLANRGIFIPFIETWEFEKKKNLYYGVMGYVERVGPKMPELQSGLAALHKLITDGKATIKDNDNFMILNQVLHQLMAASHLKRRLDQDSSFRRHFMREKEAQAINEL